MSVKVVLPQIWEEFVASQVTAGEVGGASEVVCAALHLLRDRQEEAQGSEETRFMSVRAETQTGSDEPTLDERALVGQLICMHRRCRLRT